MEKKRKRIYDLILLRFVRKITRGHFLAGQELEERTCGGSRCFLVTGTDRFAAWIGVSSREEGLMELAFGRASDTWDASVLTAATRNSTKQHLLQAESSIL